MLTKDLIISRSSGNYIHPVFVPVDSSSLLDLSERLIGVYNTSVNSRRTEISEELDEITAGYSDLKLASGLRKILDDRAVYTSSAAVDYIDERRKIFLASTKIMRSGKFTDENDYRQQIAVAVVDSGVDFNAIYSDLPDNDRLVSLGGISSKELLERYNCALVQGLLLNANSLEVTLNDASQAMLRKLISAVKFNRLVISVAVKSSIMSFSKKNDDGEVPMSIKLVIDGPGSVLKQSKSYGMQLAMIFPAIVRFANWSIRAEINPLNSFSKSTKILKLDSTSGLVSHDTYGAIIPEEIKFFFEYFKKNISDWKPIQEIPFIKGHHGTVIFPDFCFENTCKKRVYVELFHKWHSKPLAERLAELDKGIEYPLIIGVDRGIAERQETKELLEKSIGFAKCGFYYKDFPAVEKVIGMLYKA